MLQSRYKTIICLLYFWESKKNIVILSTRNTNLLIMKKIFLLTMMLLPALLKGQTYFKFVYDAVGNQTVRSVILSRAVWEADGRQPCIYQDRLKGHNIKVRLSPDKDVVNIDISNLSKEIKGNIVLANIDGMVIQKGALSVNGNTMDLSKLPHGVYVITILLGNERSSWKIIKK